MKLLFLPLVVLFFFSSCKHKSIKNTKEPQELVKEIIYPHPKFKHFIEINSVPEPFDVNGMHPYVLWINGKKMNISKVKKQLVEIVNSFENEEIQPPPSPDIHRGWMTSNLFTQTNGLHEILLKNARSSSKK